MKHTKEAQPCGEEAAHPKAVHLDDVVLSDTENKLNHQPKFLNDPDLLENAIVAGDKLRRIYTHRLASLDAFLAQARVLQAAQDSLSEALWRAA